MTDLHHQRFDSFTETICRLESQETSGCSIQEAGSLRTRWTSDAAQPKSEGLETPWGAADANPPAKPKTLKLMSTVHGISRRNHLFNTELIST